MECVAEGKIIKVLNRRIGKSKDGKEMETIEYLLEEDIDRYHYRLKFGMTSFDGPVEDTPRVGDRVRVYFTVQAKEWQDKWFNNVYAHSVKRVG